MQDDVKNDEIEQKHGVENNTGITRRRFTQASMAAPVVMSLASRPVLGQGNQCTTSGLESGNHSGVAEVHCEGCSTTSWEERTWPSQYNSDLDNNPGSSKNGTLFTTAFGITNTAHMFWGVTMMRVLTKDFSPSSAADDASAEEKELGSQAVAAILNAAELGPGTIRETFGYTTSQVATLYRDNSVDNIAWLTLKFENLHEGGVYSWISCPS